jgi:methylglutaconyl-CoA hydratase
MRNVDGCHITLDREAGVIEAVIARGSENLLTIEMCEALSDCLEAPPPGAHIMHIRAAGRVFCLGRERLATDLPGLQRETAALVRLNMGITASWLVTVAEVQGDAAGFGVGLAALCDISIAAPSARMSFPEVRMNLAPSVVLAWLPGLVGRTQAFMLTATGRELTAQQANEIGLITEVAPSDQTLSEVTNHWIASLRQFSPRVHGEIKRFITETRDMPLGAAYELGALQLIVAGLRRDVEDQSGEKGILT